jgi:hypothetical protein
MILVYGDCKRNYRAAARLYAEKHHPPFNYFIRIESSLRNSGELSARQGDKYGLVSEFVFLQQFNNKY